MVGGAIITAIPFIVALVKAIKAKKAAKTEAEKEAAQNAINAQIKALVQTAEVTYKEFDKVLKGQGSSAGVMKKQFVLTDLKSFCLENGYEWNEETASKAIDEEVAFTKTVNAKEIKTIG